MRILNYLSIWWRSFYISVEVKLQKFAFFHICSPYFRSQQFQLFVLLTDCIVLQLETSFKKELNLQVYRRYLMAPNLIKGGIILKLFIITVRYLPKKVRQIVPAQGNLKYSISLVNNGKQLVIIIQILFAYDLPHKIFPHVILHYLINPKLLK